MQTVTTLDQLLPLVAEAKTCKEFGAIVLANCPPKLKGPLSRQARDHFGWDYNDGLVRYWVNPANHSEARKAQMQATMATWLNANSEYQKEYWKGRRANDTAFKIVNLLRSRLRKVVKGLAKSASTMEFTGCTLPELMAHLEAQFTEGMTWENQGEWEIDHIKPCASFDLTKPEEQRACFHWSNLQPLWGADNRSKGDRLDWSPNANGEPD